MPWTAGVPLHLASGAYFRGFVGEADSTAPTLAQHEDDVDTLRPTTRGKKKEIGSRN